MGEQEELYNFLSSKGLINPENVTFDDFAGTLATDSGVDALYGAMKQRQLVTMGQDEFRSTFLKKKEGGRDSGPASVPFTEQPETPGQTTEDRWSYDNIMVALDSAGVPRESTAADVPGVRVDRFTSPGYTGDESVQELAEKRRVEKQGVDVYNNRFKYDKGDQRRFEARFVQNAVDVGQSAAKQAQAASDAMRTFFGDDWKEQIAGAQAALQQDPTDQVAAAKLQQLTENKYYKDWAGGTKLLTQAGQQYETAVNSGALGAYRQKAIERQREVDAQWEKAKGEGITPYLMPLGTQSKDFWMPKVDFVARKGMNMLGAMLTLPRNIGEALPGSSTSDTKVADVLAAWGDDMLSVSQAVFPKPTALQGGVFEDIVEFKGQKIVVREGQPVAVLSKAGKRNTPPRSLVEEFNASGDKDKVSIQFMGGDVLADRVAEATADLAIMRVVGGGSRIGTMAASVLTTHQGLFEEAIAAGMDVESASEYAMSGALVNGALEAFVGDIETNFAKPAVTSSRKMTADAAKMVAEGVNPTKAAWEATKGILKETANENGEELLQALAGDYNRTVFTRPGGELKPEMDTKSIGETLLATTIVTAPLAAVGMAGHTTRARRGSLMAAIDSPTVFAETLGELTSAGVVTPEAAAEAVQRVTRLKMFRDNLPPGLTFEEQSQILGRQEFVEIKEREAKAEGVLPAVREQAKTEAKVAKEEIKQILGYETALDEMKGREGSPTNEPVAPTIVERAAPEYLGGDMRTVREMNAALNTGDVDTTVAAQQEALATIESDVRQTLTEFGFDAQLTPAQNNKLTDLVARRFFNEAEADFDAPVAATVEAVAQEFATREELPLILPKELPAEQRAASQFFAAGNRISARDADAAPTAAPNYFAEDGVPLNDAAVRLAQEAGVSVSAMKQELLTFMSDVPDKSLRTGNLRPIRQAVAEVDPELARVMNYDELAATVPVVAEAEVKAEALAQNQEVVQFIEENKDLSIDEVAEKVLAGEGPAALMYEGRPNYSEEGVAVGGTEANLPEPATGAAVEGQNAGGEIPSTERSNSLAEEVSQALPVTRVTPGAAGVTDRRALALAAAGDLGVPVVPIPKDQAITSKQALMQQADQDAAIADEMPAAIPTPGDSLGGLIVAETDTEVIFANTDGARVALQQAGAKWVPGRGFVAPIAEKSRILQRIRRSQRPGYNLRKRFGVGAESGRLSAAMRDPFVHAANLERERALRVAATLNDAIDVLERDSRLPDNPHAAKVEQVTAQLQGLFPNVTVVTDTAAFDAALPNQKQPRPAGFLKDGVVYIDMRRAGPDTPMHEFGHLWLAALKEGSPALYQQGIEAMRRTEYYDAVLNNPFYSSYGEQALLEEALALAIGERGARLMGKTRWEKFFDFFMRLRDWAIRAVGLGRDPFNMTAAEMADLLSYQLTKGAKYSSREIAAIKGDVVEYQYTAKDAEYDVYVANQMRLAGMDNRAIQAVTGWRVGAAGRWEWRPRPADVTPDIRLAANGETLPLEQIMSAPQLFAASNVAQAQVLFSDTVKRPALAIQDGRALILMPTAGDADSLVAGLRNIAQDLAKIEALGYDISYATEVDAAGEFQESETRPALEKIIDAFRAAEMANADDPTYRATMGDVPMSGPAGAAIFERQEPTVIGFEGEDLPRGYDPSTDALRRAAMQQGARIIIEQQYRKGANAGDVANALFDRLGIDRAWTLAQWQDVVETSPGGSRLVDFTRAKRKEALLNMVGKVKTFMTKHFSYKGLLPKDIFDLSRKRQGEVAATMAEMGVTVDRLERSMQAEFGEKVTIEQRELVDAILKGDASIDQVSPELGAVIIEIRGQVDALSRRLLHAGGLSKSVVLSIMEGLSIETRTEDGDILSDADYISGVLSKPPFERSPEEIKAVDQFLQQYSGQFGTYLNRSYRVHDFPDWRDRVDPEALANAKSLIIGQLRAQADEITQGLMEFESDRSDQYESMRERIRAIVNTTNDAVAEAVKSGDEGEISRLNATQDEILALANISKDDPAVAEMLAPRTTTKGIPRDVTRVRVLRRKMLEMEQQVEVVRKKAGAQLDDLHGRIKNIDGEISRIMDYDAPLAMVRPGTTLGTKDRGILKMRKDIPDEIRALLGEYRDPVVNVAKTMAKMSALIANTEFLNAMRTRYEGVYFFRDKGANEANWKQFGTESSATLAPLAGWYTTPEIYDAMVSFYEPAQMEWWQRLWISQVVKAVKLGKTVLSPVTHPRNFFGNIAFHAVNGWLPTAANQARRDWKEGGKAWAARKKIYYRYGILGESVQAADLKNLVEDLEARYSTTDGMGLLDQALAPIAQAGAFVYNKAKRVYELEDEIHRIVGFENERVKYARAWYGMSFEELSPEQQESVNAKAADVINSIMPTASFVPRVVKMLRTFPFTGTFVTFPAEMIRVTYNTVALARDEMKDPRTFGIGFRRMAGLAAVVGGTQALVLALRALFGQDDEYWKSVNDMLPEWNKNSQLVPISTSKKGYPQYINLSYTNPFSFLNRSMNGLMNADKPGEAAMQALSAFTDPFAAPELTFNTLDKAMRNIDDRGNPIMMNSLRDPVFNTNFLHPENIAREAAYVAKKLQPGLARSVWDFTDIVTDDVDQTGRVKTWNQYMLEHLVGVRVETFDPTVAVASQMNALERDKRESRKAFTQRQGELNRAWDNMHRGDEQPTARREQNLDDRAAQQLNEAYDLSMEAYLATIRRASALAQDATRLGIDTIKVVDMLKEAGFSAKAGEIDAIMSGNVSKLRLKFDKKGRY